MSENHVLKRFYQNVIYILQITVFYETLKKIKFKTLPNLFVVSWVCIDWNVKYKRFVREYM